MVVAETLAGIALVKSAVDGIKSAIATAKDVGDIAHEVDKPVSYTHLRAHETR